MRALVQDAKELRLIMINEISQGLDLLMCDRVRKAYVLSRANLQPRLPFIGSLPTPTPPPLFVPGKGLVQLDEFVNTFFPKLTDEEEVLLDTQLELATAILGADPDEFGTFDLEAIPQLFLNPTEQIRDLQRTLANISASPDDATVVRLTALEIASNLANSLADRGGVPVSNLFPFMPDAGREKASSKVEQIPDHEISSAVSSEATDCANRASQRVGRNAGKTGESSGTDPALANAGAGIFRSGNLDNSQKATSSTVVVNRTGPIHMVELN